MIKDNSIVESPNKSRRTESIDVLKLVLAFLVVVIHTPFSGHIGTGITAFARIAVPLFFMITGYYLPTMKANKFKQHIKKILLLTIMSTLFYLVLSYRSFYGTEITTDNWLVENFNLKKISKWILFNDTPASGHLWYFYALLYVFLIFYILKKLKHINILFKIAPLLFLCNYLLSFGPTMISYRNFLFTGLPYMVLGCMFRKHEEHLLNLFSKSRILVMGLILFIFGLGIELWIYKWLGMVTDRDHYLFTLPMAAGIFLLVLQYPHYGAGSYMALIGRKYSAYIYIMHPFFMFLIHGTLKVLVGEWIFQNILYINLLPFLVFGATTIGVIIGYKIWILLYSKVSYLVLSKFNTKKES